MKLEVGHIFINDIQFASESKIENGVLYVDEEAVKAIVLEDEKSKMLNLISQNQVKAFVSLRLKMLLNHVLKLKEEGESSQALSQKLTL